MKQMGRASCPGSKRMIDMRGKFDRFKCPGCGATFISSEDEVACVPEHSLDAPETENEYQKWLDEIDSELNTLIGPTRVQYLDPPEDFFKDFSG